MNIQSFRGFVSISLVTLSAYSYQACAAHSWTGWYLGGDLGYANGDVKQKVVGLEGEWVVTSQAEQDIVTKNWPTNLEPSGSSFSVKGGYLYQFMGQPFVIGGELDYTQLDIKKSRDSGVISVPGGGAQFTNRVDIKSALSLRGKVGYTQGQHLFYGVLGLTQADISSYVGINLGGVYLNSSDTSDTVSGVQLGLGYALAFTQSWALNVQYIATVLDDTTYSTKANNGISNGTFERFKQETEFGALQVGLSYHF